MQRECLILLEFDDDLAARQRDLRLMLRDSKIKVGHSTRNIGYQRLTKKNLKNA